jgi:hypothetical protein
VRSNRPTQKQAGWVGGRKVPLLYILVYRAINTKYLSCPSLGLANFHAIFCFLLRNLPSKVIGMALNSEPSSSHLALVVAQTI